MLSTSCRMYLLIFFLFFSVSGSDNATMHIERMGIEWLDRQMDRWMLKEEKNNNLFENNRKYFEIDAHLNEKYSFHIRAATTAAVMATVVCIYASANRRNKRQDKNKRNPFFLA